MTLAELKDSLEQRLHQPLMWGAFVVADLAYARILFADIPFGELTWLMVLKNLPKILVTSGFYFAFVWLAALPWQWDGRPGRPGLTWRGGLQCVLFSVGWMRGLVWIDTMIDLAAGNLAAAAEAPGAYRMATWFFGPALCLVGGLIAHMERMEWERGELRLQAIEARERQLRAQLQPHTLFNALNGLAELVEEDPKSTGLGMRAVSRLLRRLLKVEREESSPLEAERELADDYLQIEGIRLLDRLWLEWNWDESVNRIPVIPVLLLPLVENAVKHGIAPCPEGGKVVVSAALEAGWLVLKVSNTGIGLGSVTATGSQVGPHRAFTSGTQVGLANLKSRLDMAYGADARFELRTEGDWTVAEIRIRRTVLGGQP